MDDLQKILRAAYDVPAEVSGIIAAYKSKIEWESRLWEVGAKIYPSLQTKIFSMNALRYLSIYDGVRLLPDHIFEGQIDIEQLIDDIWDSDDMCEWVRFSDWVEASESSGSHPERIAIDIMQRMSFWAGFFEHDWVVKSLAK